jgi:uncharacterized protein YbaR (Trm112 family)
MRLHDNAALSIHVLCCPSSRSRHTTRLVVHTSSQQHSKVNLQVQLRLNDTTHVLVSDVCTGVHEELDFTEAVTNFAVGYGRAVVATLTSCKVFAAESSFGSSSAVASVDLHGMLLGIQLAPRCFMLLIAGQPPTVRIMDPLG